LNWRASFIGRKVKECYLLKACPKCGSEDFVKKGSDTNVKHAITVRKLGEVKPQRFWWMAFALG
jgi:predicted nucleic-acid-binding Zn-ribbon protein